MAFATNGAARLCWEGFGDRAASAAAPPGADQPLPPALFGLVADAILAAAARAG